MRIAVCLFICCVTFIAPDLLFAGTITTIAGTGKAQLDKFTGPATDVNIGQPFGVEVGPNGDLFVTEVGNHRVLKIDRETAN